MRSVIVTGPKKSVHDTPYEYPMRETAPGVWEYEDIRMPSTYPPGFYPGETVQDVKIPQKTA